MVLVGIEVQGDDHTAVKLEAREVLLRLLAVEHDPNSTNTFPTPGTSTPSTGRGISIERKAP